MKCPECEAAGKTSRVYVGAQTSTLMGFTPYYDEQARHHYNDPNRHTTRYSCSNGHHWEETKGPAKEG